MSTDAARFSDLVTVGPPRRHAALTVFPLFAAGAVREGEYLTLEEAIETDEFLVTEVSESGSVPDLKVVNRLKRPVLIIDGEELVGAKQNRMVNTTILIAAGSELTIPVSCTEAGRWRHTSRHFTVSSSMTPSLVRSRKSRSVSRSLLNARRHRSEQGEVWDSIADLSIQASVESDTDALHDIITGRQKDLEGYRAAFAPAENQVGLIAAIGGDIVGLDYVSSSRAYARLADRMLNAYAMDALISPAKSETVESEPQAEAFLREIDACPAARYPGAGLGEESRYDTPALVGVSLEYDDHLLHAGFQRQVSEVPPAE